ncbi:MAG: hypothetical protein HOQ18_10410 [Dermatophilaceae bacterium]|nr:hypothetical protein [Dermatophilaceae bacterium]
MKVARDWDERADELAAQAISDGAPTAWFDRLYTEGSSGVVGMPRAPWSSGGLGADAEYLASLGFDTVAFDVAPTTSLATAREPVGRHTRR